jgi:hypothetical protein
MAEFESQQTSTDFQGELPSHGSSDGIGTLPAPRAQPPSDSEEDRPTGGISIIPIPKREIARLQGTLRLSELPRHKPTIVFDTARQFRDADDE